MALVLEQNTYIALAYFRSGNQNDNAEWIYSTQAAFEQFRQAYPDEEINYRMFVQRCGRIAGRFIETGSVQKGKSSGPNANVTTQNAVNDIQRRMEQSPK